MASNRDGEDEAEAEDMMGALGSSTFGGQLSPPQERQEPRHAPLAGVI